MSPQTAVDLVGRYSRLTLAIRGCGPRIAAELDKCKGLKGFRLETEHVPEFDGGPWVGRIEAHDRLTDRAEKDQQTHLSVWYSEDYGEPGEWGFERYSVGEGDEAEDCPACYAAHLIVQERKGLRRQLGYVKGAMTRLGSKAQETKPA